jgi:Flp pilus assembly protein TadD
VAGVEQAGGVFMMAYRILTGNGDRLSGASVFPHPTPLPEETGTGDERKHLPYLLSPRKRSGVRVFQYPVRNPVHFAALLALCLLAVMVPAQGSDFEEAYELSRRLETAQSAWHDALKSGDPAAIERQEAKLRETATVTRNAYEAAGANASEDPVVLHRYAAALRSLGDHDLAAGVLTRAVRLAPEEAALWMHLGADLAESGPGVREEAFQALHKSLELEAKSPTAAQAHFLLGDLYYREGLFDFAREHQESALRLEPDHVRARIALAALRISAGEVLEGSRDLDALGRRAQPYDAETRVLLREALTDFDAARRVFPDTPEHHAAYARALYRAARFPDAILAARRAATLNPEDFDTWNFIAAVQGQLGNLPQARDAYTKSLEANPDQPQVRAILEEMKED